MTLLLDTHVFLWWVNGEPIPSDPVPGAERRTQASHREAV